MAVWVISSGLCCIGDSDILGNGCAGDSDLLGYAVHMIVTFWVMLYR